MFLLHQCLVFAAHYLIFFPVHMDVRLKDIKILTYSSPIPSTFHCMSLLTLLWY
uniref:Uncharacterized protein n=1 Tax=Arundo donax TaxID=35708 RepID=A0A0A9BAR2_ARUDO